MPQDSGKTAVVLDGSMTRWIEAPSLTSTKLLGTEMLWRGQMRMMGLHSFLMGGGNLHVTTVRFANQTALLFRKIFYDFNRCCIYSQVQSLGINEIVHLKHPRWNFVCRMITSREVVLVWKTRGGREDKTSRWRSVVRAITYMPFGGVGAFHSSAHTGACECACLRVSMWNTPQITWASDRALGVTFLGRFFFCNLRALKAKKKKKKTNWQNKL